MCDDEFIASFEACTLPPERFRHADHVHLAWLYLRRSPVLAALARFRRALRRFAASQGKPERYHETITSAYFLLIHERVHRTGQHKDWPSFALANPDLLDWNDRILHAYYDPATLDSEFARRVFVFPEPSYRTVVRRPAIEPKRSVAQGVGGLAELARETDCHGNP
jgi:hypothetical protein